jgi:ElaB/YqjD/DUF883 family membrane-anchored ribosome-binding protein
MAAERDQAGAPGAGLSGAGRSPEGMREATDGAPMREPTPGTAEVRGGLHSGGGDEYAGLQFARDADAGAAERVRGAARETREKAEGLGARARHLAEELGSRATGAASTARERVTDLRDRTNRTLERRGIVDRIRENPLPVLGVAFAIGFILAGDEDRGSRTRGARARRELRNALMAGLSAGIAQGARAFFSEAGSEGSSFVSSLLDNLTGESGGGGERGRSGEGRDRWGEDAGGRIRGVTQERF